MNSAELQGRTFKTVAIIAFTRRGCALAKKLAEGLARHAVCPQEGIAVSGPARFADELGISAYQSLGAWTSATFGAADALIYVGAAGIAVRAIAPHVRDKFADPAVVSVDEAGLFAVPLLSGHVGGANELARDVAAITGGQAVVSTATDVNGLFAVDEWATERNMRLLERHIAKEISSRLLDGDTVGFASDLDCTWDVPEQVIGPHKDIGFAISYYESFQPFARTLHLLPPAAVVGVGCRKGISSAVLELEVDAALAAAHVPLHAVSLLASIDVKKDEPAIRTLARRRAWELRFYSAEELAAVPGEFTPSDFVRETVGVDNVCERAALAQGGRLLLGKQAHNGVTVAVAMGVKPFDIMGIEETLTRR